MNQQPQKLIFHDICLFNNKILLFYLKDQVFQAIIYDNYLLIQNVAIFYNCQQQYRMMRRLKQSKAQKQLPTQKTIVKINPSVNNVPLQQNLTALPQKSIAITNLQQKPTTKKITKESDQLKDKLKKQFKKFSNLPLEELRKISQSMALYIEEKKKNMDHKDGQFVRFTFRNEILKILMISVLELTVQQAKTINALEDKLLEQNCNRIEMLAIISHNLQCYLYEELFNPKETKARLQPYQCQIRLLITNLNDVNNFALRRGILNGTISYEFIKGATEEQMMSEETKRKEKQRMIQEVRQSQVWQERDFNKKSEQITQDISEKKEKQEIKINHKWASEKVEELKNYLQDIGKIWLRRQKDLQGYYGTFKKSMKYNRNLSD